MKIALDATPLSVPTGGIPRYTTQLWKALREEFPEDEFQLVTEQRTNFVTRRWWLLGLPIELAAKKYDLFHGTDFAVPYMPVRLGVLTLHDLSPWKRAFWRAPSARVQRRTPYLIRLGLPTIVVTPTEAIRREAIEAFRIHPSRIVAVPLAAAPYFRPVTDLPSRKPYFLSLGVLEPRKNLPMLVEAWREVRRTHEVDLVLAGRARYDAPLIEPAEGLHIGGTTNEERLPALFSGAVASLLPTFYEGFGLPLLESMQCGCPVIASTDPALREVSGGAAIHLDPHDTAGWVSAMTALVESEAQRQELREAGLRRAREFSWARTARMTYEVYEEARRRW